MRKLLLGLAAFALLAAISAPAMADEMHPPVHKAHHKVRHHKHRHHVAPVHPQ